VISIPQPLASCGHAGRMNTRVIAIIALIIAVIVLLIILL
jgi:hypothetical protein